MGEGVEKTQQRSKQEHTYFIGAYLLNWSIPTSLIKGTIADLKRKGGEDNLSRDGDEHLSRRPRRPRRRCEVDGPGGQGRVRLARNTSGHDFVRGVDCC